MSLSFIEAKQKPLRLVFRQTPSDFTKTAISLSKPFAFAPLVESHRDWQLCAHHLLQDTGQAEAGPSLTWDPRGCFPAPWPQGNNEHCCSAALDMPGWSWINDSHPQGALTGQTHPWRQNQQQCQCQACITSPPGEWIHNFQESVAGGSTSSQVKA